MKKIVSFLLLLAWACNTYAVDITLPSQKGSALNTAEFEANHKRQLTAKTGAYTTVVTDNRDTIEVNSGGAVTITLADASDMISTSDTGDYQVTIASIGAGTVTVARTSTDTIDGATSYTITQYGAATFKANAAGNGYDIISADKAANLYASTTLGVGTTTVPHGAIGSAIVAIDGPDSSNASGPHVQITTDADNYPLIQLRSISHDNIGLYFDSYVDGAGTVTSSDAGSNFKIEKSSDVLTLSYDSGIAAGSAVTFNTGLSLATDGTVTIPGSITHSAACASGFTRVSPGFCLKDTFSLSALTRDACTSYAAPAADATSVLIVSQALAKANNAIASRNAVITAWEDSGCTTTSIDTVAESYAYEFSAVTATTILDANAPNERFLQLPSVGATIYLKFTDDTGDRGTANASILGYTTN